MVFYRTDALSHTLSTAEWRELVFRTVAIICHGHIILKEGTGTGKKDTVHT